MLSFSHMVIIVMAVIIFISPDKIPQFFKSLAEGMAIFKKTFNDQLDSSSETKVHKKKDKILSKRHRKKSNQNKKS